MKPNHKATNTYIESLSEEDSAKFNKDALEVLLKSDTPEELHNKIISNKEAIKKFNSKQQTLTFDVSVSYKIKNEEFVGSGATLEEASREVKNKFPYRMSKAVEKLYAAQIKYSFSEYVTERASFFDKCETALNKNEAGRSLYPSEGSYRERFEESKEAFYNCVRNGNIGHWANYYVLLILENAREMQKTAKRLNDKGRFQIAKKLEELACKLSEIYGIQIKEKNKENSK